MQPKKIQSFTIDHNKLVEGIYISRTDGDIVTYDLRTRRPNMGDYMDNVTMHTVEHMAATYIRSSEIGENIIYFGPMGCRTGFYLLVRNESAERVYEVLCDVLLKIINHEGEVFGNTAVECGNYRELDLEKGKTECRRYLDILQSGTPDFKYK